MAIHFHPHTQERMKERGTTENEVKATIEHGEPFPAKFQRTGFRRNFPFDSMWRGRRIIKSNKWKFMQSRKVSIG